jgi:hypothetical protein
VEIGILSQIGIVVGAEEVFTQSAGPLPISQ